MVTKVEQLKNLFNLINPLLRMANSDGMNRSFLILKKKFPKLIIRNFKPGFRAGDWTVPRQWNLKYSFLKDSEGKIIVSSRESELFVSPNSIKVNNKKITGKEIIKNTICLERLPKSFILNHKHTYDYNVRQKSWGLSIPLKKLKKIKKNKKYHLLIDSFTTKRPMQVGEFFIKGKTNKIICIAAHIDELCNDNLSGSIAAIELYNRLKNKKNYFSYQILHFPEHYGPIFYAKKFPAKIKKTLFMLNLETVGAGKNWCLKKSLNSNLFIEDCLKFSFSKNKKKFKELNFFDGYINDEKIYAWPKLDIPGVSIQRYPYNYYHTSNDTLEKINYNFILDAVKIAGDMMNIFEKKFNLINKNYIPVLRQTFPPWLTKRKLYIGGNKKNIFPQNYYNNLFNEKLLFSINGKKSLALLASELKINFIDCYNYLEKLHTNKIIKKIKIFGKNLLQ